MAKREKKGYQGPKLSGDDEVYRKKRAKQNSQGDNRESNETFALNNQEFKEACERGNIPATARQASKYRNGYGRAYQNRQTAAA